jgi:hypothetical protein
MVVPSAAHGFRATVRTIISLDGKVGMRFHTFKLAEDQFVQLLVKKLGRGMLESVVRDEFESLDIHVT